MIDAARSLLGVEQNAGSLNQLPFKPVRAASPFHSSEATTVAVPTAENAMRPLSVGAKTMYGTIVYNPNFNSNSDWGIYTVPVAPTGDMQQVVQSVAASGKSIAGYANGYVVSADLLSIGNQFLGETVYVVNAETGKTVSQKNLELPIQFYDMSCDPITGVLYGCRPIVGGTELAIFDYNKFTTSSVATLSQPYFALSFDGKGDLYGISETGTLVKIDKETGAESVVGETGVATQYVTSGVIDPSTSTFYYCALGDDFDSMYAIDITTAQATLLYNISDQTQFGCLFITDPGAEDKAPSAAANLLPNFGPGELTGVLQFSTLSIAYDGTKMEYCDIEYTVTANGAEVATGITHPGWLAKAPITLPSAGYYNFTVTLKNEFGESPKSSVRAFVGPDVPALMTEVSLTYADGRMSLTWEEPQSDNGGAIDNSLITYDIVRYPDDKTVATAVATNSWSEEYPMPEDYTEVSYGVKLIYDGNAMGEKLSNTVAVGPVQLPWTEPFDSELGLQGFTIINGNEDSRTFVFTTANGGCVRCYRSPEGLDMDDWLITPAVKLEKGNPYRIAFTAFSSSSSLLESMEVKLGSSPSPGSMTQTIFESYTLPVATSKDAVKEYYFVPEETGIFYLGFHGVSPAGKQYLCVSEVSVSAKLGSSTPATVTDLVVTADPTARLEATVSFTTPTVNILGGELTELTAVEVYRNGEVVKTIANPGIGEAVSFIDEVDVAGYHDYQVYALNSAGTSQPVAVNLHVGPGIPKNVSSLTAVAVDDYTVHFEWPAVTTDIFDQPLTEVTYIIAQVVNNQGYPIVTGITDTKADIKVTEEGAGQDFMRFAVYAVGTEGLSQSGMMHAGSLAMGDPYEVPFNESVKNGQLMSNWAISYDDAYSKMEWGITTVDNLHSAIPSYSFIDAQDSDNGVFFSQASSVGDSGNIESLKIDLRDCDAATLRFYVFAFANGRNGLKVAVNDGASWTQVLSTTCAPEGESNVWKPVEVDLTGFCGKEIRIRLTTSAATHIYCFIDNITVTGYRLAAPHSLKAAHDGNGNVSLVWSAPESDDASSGYNVYHNNEKLNAEPVAETAYLHENVTKDGNLHSYHVTALYAAGESKGSDTVSVDMSAVDSVSTNDVNVFSANGCIIVEIADPTLAVSVYSTDGRLVSSAVGSTRYSFPVSGGIYVVSAGKLNVKLNVK